MAKKRLRCAHPHCERWVFGARYERGCLYCSRRCRLAAKAWRSPSRSQYLAQRTAAYGAMAGDEVLASVVASVPELAEYTDAMRVRVRKAQQKTPFAKFTRSADPVRRLKVLEDDASQQQARSLIAAGWTAYENRKGIICDVGQPKHPNAAGRVFSRVAA